VEETTEQPPPKFISTLKFRGANREFIVNHASELIVCAPSDTGKTYAACCKSIILCFDNPGCHGAIVRKTYNSLNESVLRTFDRIADGLGIRKLGGEHADQYLFPNGSKLVAVGMDKPDKLLSSEWDFIQVCQTEELKESDWEVMVSRCTGRGAVIPHPQVFGDCNPAGSRHFLRARAKRGQLTMLNGTHKDNPELYDDAGNITPLGKARIGKLEATLTGVRRKRLLEGIWATAEGAVYDTFDASIHVKTRLRSEMKRFFLAIDDGYTNPAVILDIGEDSDGRWHCFREFYQRGQARETVVAEARSWQKQFPREVVAVDEAVPELIAQLNAAGMTAKGGKGKVIDGIRKVQDRLKIQGDGLPRLTTDSSCVNLINELESYAWRPEQDVPIKENDHACFVAGTKITTKRGDIDIEKVTKQDLVLTPFGWSKVKAAESTGMNKVVNFGIFTSTPQHPVFTNRGIIPIDSISLHDTMSVCLKLKKLYLTGQYIEDTQNHLTIEHVFISSLITRKKEALNLDCIKPCGNTLKEKFLTVKSFITKTAIQQTTKSAILNVLRNLNMRLGIKRHGEGQSLTWTKSDLCLKHGTQVQKENFGTPKTQDDNGKTRQSLKRFASDAGIHSELNIMRADSAGLCVNSGNGFKNTLTYNLATEYGCYFANGILVSNCDSLRYLEDVLSEPTGAFISTEGIRVGQGGSLLMPDVLGAEDLDLKIE